MGSHNTSADFEYASEEQYGYGDELSTTSMLVFGILSFWVFTVISYRNIINKHYRQRIEYFGDVANYSDIGDVYKNALRINNAVFAVPAILYSLCLVLFLSEIILQILVQNNKITFELFDSLTMKLIYSLSLLFLIASYYFIIGVMLLIKKHEANEFILLHHKFNIKSDSIKLSNKFVKRWNEYKNSITLYLIILLPIIVTPYIATRQIKALIDSSGANFVTYIYYWFIPIVIGAIVFHFYGIRILQKLYNGHLSIERENYVYFDNTKHSSKSSLFLQEAREYKVFLSFKSEDITWAYEMYNFLEHHNICTFFSKETLSALGSDEYRLQIDRAIDSCEHMIVLASTPEYVNSEWVRYEWGLFLNEKLSRRKSGNLTTVITGAMKPEDLPISLRDREALQYPSSNFERILSYLK